MAHLSSHIDMNDRVNGYSSARASDDPMPSTSDFVKKLYKMLEDPAFQSVVSWGPQGDCFVVKDMNEFTKSILPRMFKHSNFASFVRQLNKYDFHKVKNTDDNQFGEQSWTFRHPDFHADRRDALENIKRKVPAARKSQPSSTLPLSSHPYPSSSSRGRSTSPLGSLPPHLSTLHSNTYPSVPVLQAEIQRLREEGNNLRGRVRSLEQNYEKVLVEMVAFQRGMAEQDGVMQNMISYFLGTQSGKGKAPQPEGNAQGYRSFVPPTDAASSTSTFRDPSSSSSTAQQLQAQLKQQQGQHERAQIILEAQLNQASRERKRHEMIDMLDQASSPSPGIQEFFSETMQPQSSAANPSSLDTPQYDGVLPSFVDTNPFLPPQAVQRIIGAGVPARSSTPNGSELGKASLLQMNELSRRAASFSANGGEGNFWSGMNFPGDGPSSKEGRVPAQNIQPGDRQSRGLDQARDGYREIIPSGWQGSNATMSIGGGASAGFSTRSMGEDRERVGFNVSMARDDSSVRLPMGMPGAVEERRGTQQARQGERNFLVSDDTKGGVDDSNGYIMASQTQKPAIEQTQQAPLSIPGTKMMGSVPNPWASLMAGQAVIDMFDSTQLGFNPQGGNAEDDGSLTHEGLQVYTVGHLLPKGIGIGGGEDCWGVSTETGNQSFGGAGGQEQPGGYRASTQFSPPVSEGDSDEVVRPTPSNSLIKNDPPTLASSSGSGSQKLRVRRSTYVPGWAVPPRVLLVDDDAVSRTLSSKFLKVFGCTTDVAVDGVGAVNKMNLEKYDLVLMDIVMPKLDGVSATSLIRKFDQGTPIISMTSNSKPNEIMNYYSSGMNDILPKPFTKEGLLDMLEKHLRHLKVIQQMSRLPRSISAPMLEQGAGSGSGSGSNPSALQSIRDGAPLPSMPESSSSAFPSSAAAIPGLDGRSFDDEGISLLAGMGLTDDQYTLILQNMVNGDGFFGMMDSDVPPGGIEKRSLDDLGEDGRGRKRSRFETIE